MGRPDLTHSGLPFLLVDRAVPFLLQYGRDMGMTMALSRGPLLAERDLKTILSSQMQQQAIAFRLLPEQRCLPEGQLGDESSLIRLPIPGFSGWDWILPQRKDKVWTSDALRRPSCRTAAGLLLPN